MNHLLVSTPFIVFGGLVLLYLVLAMSSGRTRSGSSKSLSGSLSKVLMGSGKKSSKKSSPGKKYMGFTVPQLLLGAAVIGGIYYYKEGYTEGLDHDTEEDQEKMVVGI